MAQGIIFAYSYNKFHAPVHIYERQIPDPRELSIGQIAEGVPGGMVTPGIDSCISKTQELLWLVIMIMIYVHEITPRNHTQIHMFITPFTCINLIQ
jgi:hypothetical protein